MPGALHDGDDFTYDIQRRKYIVMCEDKSEMTLHCA